MLESVSAIKHFFSIQRIAFRCLSIDVTSVECKVRRPFFIWLIFVCNITLILALTKYGWENRDDISKLSAALIPILQISISVIKFLTILKKRKNMGQLLHNIWVLTIDADSEELPIIAEENKKDFMFGVCYYISILFAVVITLAIPIFITIFVYIKTKQLQFFHILQTSYPFDQNQPTNYFITYCFLVGCVYFAAHSILANDTLYSWLILNTAAQFRVLQLKLRKVALNYQDCDMDYALIRCIRLHQKIISIADEINNFFRMIIFVEVLKDCLLFCFIAFQLVHFNSFERSAYLLTFLISASVQLIIYCYGGQRIQDESKHISDFIYDIFSWHSIAIRDKKSLMIIIARAQKCCQLSGFFFTVNWQLLLQVVRTNYSYISLLFSFDENKAN